MKLKSTMSLFSGAAGGDSHLVHPPGLVTDTPKVRDIARRRLVKTNPDVDAAKYKEDSQSDNKAFTGKKFRTQDTKYGHEVNEFDDEAEAFKSSLARPYTRVIKQPEPQFVKQNRDSKRKKVVKENPDVQ